MDPNVMSALIGAVVAVIGIVVKDVVLRLLEEKRHRRRSKRQLLALYAKPIIKSAETLSWRLREVFTFRGSFLRKHDVDDDFLHHKFLSTVYRLCALLGWLTALNRELAYVDGNDRSGNEEAESALKQFRSALADGNEEEIRTLQGVARSFRTPIEELPVDGQQKLAIEVDRCRTTYARHASSSRKKHKIAAFEQDAIDQIADAFRSAGIERPPESKALDDKARTEIIGILTRKQHWIYRDVQKAIGDQMLVRDPDSPRRYSVLSFAEFDSLFASENKWTAHVVRLLDGVDVSGSTTTDARVSQLKKLAKATVNLIVTFGNTIRDEATISENAKSTLLEFRDSSILTT